LKGQNLSQNAALEDATMDEEVTETALPLQSAGVDNPTRLDHQCGFEAAAVFDGEQTGALAHADEL
jgi:hypothetical protein